MPPIDSVMLRPAVRSLAAVKAPGVVIDRSRPMAASC